MQDFELNPENYTLSGGHWKTSVEINHLFSLIKERNYALVGFFFSVLLKFCLFCVIRLLLIWRPPIKTVPNGDSWCKAVVDRHEEIKKIMEIERPSAASW